MKTYQNQVNKLIQELAIKIIQGKLKGKRDIDKAIRELSKQLDIPMIDFIARLKKQTKINAIKEASLSMARNTDSVIKSITHAEIATIVNDIFNKPVAMQRLNGKDLIDYAISFINELDVINKRVAKDVRSVILGGYISGATPTEIANNLIKSTRNKRVRNALKAISATILHKAQETTNLEQFAKNSQYIKWVKYQTVEDDRVTHVCNTAQKESEELQLSPKEYIAKRLAVPSLHFNCRCYLSPIN